MTEPECTGRCASLTESGAGYIDPKCPKHGEPADSEPRLVDTGNFFVQPPRKREGS